MSYNNNNDNNSTNVCRHEWNEIYFCPEWQADGQMIVGGIGGEERRGCGHRKYGNECVGGCTYIVCIHDRFPHD